MQAASLTRCAQKTRIISTNHHTPWVHKHTQVECETTYTHTEALAINHNYTHTHCCCAYLPTIGPDPDTACQCTSLHEPQAAGARRRNRWVPAVWMWALGTQLLYCNTCTRVLVYTHTCMNTNSFKLFDCAHVYNTSRIYWHSFSETIWQLKMWGLKFKRDS